MDITHFVLHNDDLGKFSKEPRVAHFNVWKTKRKNPNSSALAEDVGCHAVREMSNGGPETALQYAIAHKRPSLVEPVADAVLT